MAQVVDKDLGYDELVRQLGDIGQPRVLVGILQDKGSELAEGGDITLAGYAAVNEFGSEDGHVPERSFMRSTVDANQMKYANMVQIALGRAVDAISSGGGASTRVLENELGVIGNVAVGDIKKTIRVLRQPKNADSTLARKFPANNPLIHTRRMSQSISFLVDMEGGG